MIDCRRKSVNPRADGIGPDAVTVVLDRLDEALLEMPRTPRNQRPR
jgi:hypothetical protein